MIKELPTIQIEKAIAFNSLTAGVANSILLACKDDRDPEYQPIFSQLEGASTSDTYDPFLIETINARLFLFASIHNLTIDKGIVPNENLAQWIPEERKILIRDGLRRLDWIEALTHEIAHFVAGHDKDSPDTRIEEEILAHGAAFVFLKEYGIDTGTSNFPMIAFYSLINKDTEMVHKKGSDILCTVELINAEINRGLSPRTTSLVLPQ